MGVWKNGAKCAVMFTVDFDAETLWLSRDPENEKRPGTLSQGHYGAKVGVPLLLDLLAREEIKATFFVPGRVAEKYGDTIKQIARAGHEIGHHGYLHEWADPSNPQKEEDILVKGINILEYATGKKPVGYRSPAWEISANVCSLLKKYNFLYSSNMMDDLMPHWLEVDGQLYDVVELPVQWLLDDAPYFLFSVRPPSRSILANNLVLSNWKEEFAGIYELGALYNIVVHPQLSGRPSRINMLRSLFAYIREFPDVWFATGEEIARFWREELSKKSL